jgi:hypothetical protein
VLITLRIALLCTAALFAAPALAATNATVTDVKGQAYNVSSIKLAKGSKLKVVCGETRLEVPFKSVVSMKVAPAQITSVDGKLYFGVEIKTRDGAAIGSLGGANRCSVSAESGFKGKTASKSKVGYSSPLSNVASLEILGKDAAKTGGGEDGEEEDE